MCRLSVALNHQLRLIYIPPISSGVLFNGVKMLARRVVRH